MGALDPLYASLDSFFGLGRSEISGGTSLTESVALAEGIIGVFLIFYFTVLLTRKIVR